MTHSRRVSDGFTLVELLIAIVIGGILMTTLVAALSFTMRQQKEIITRIDESRGPQFANQWFANDVASATTVSIATTSPPFTPAQTCTPATSPGTVTNVLVDLGIKTLTDLRQPQTKTVSYVIVQTSNGARALHRFACSVDVDITLPATTALTGGTDTRLARNILPSAPTTCNAPSNWACIQFQSSDAVGGAPTTFVLSAARRTA